MLARVLRQGGWVDRMDMLAWQVVSTADRCVWPWQEEAFGQNNAKAIDGEFSTLFRAGYDLYLAFCGCTNSSGLEVQKSTFSMIEFDDESDGELKMALWLRQFSSLLDARVAVLTRWLCRELLADRNAGAFSFTDRSNHQLENCQMESRSFFNYAFRCVSFIIAQLGGLFRLFEVKLGDFRPRIYLIAGLFSSALPTGVVPGAFDSRCLKRRKVE